MRRVIRKSVRKSRDGMNVAADVDVVIAINNTDADAEASHTVSRSSHRVVQGGKRDETREPPSRPSDSREEQP
jgi:hypothetical protein